MNKNDAEYTYVAGLPEDFGSRDWKPPTESPCIIKLLCDKHEGLEIEAKVIKEHWWKPHIKKLFDKKVHKHVFKLRIFLAI